MTKEFFKVTPLERIPEFTARFGRMGTEIVGLKDARGRILGEDCFSDLDLPGFARSTMDGFAVQAASTFGASEGSPAYLTVKGSVAMGEGAEFSIGPGETARISTGGMLPEGADAVVMVEHTEEIAETEIEVCRSVAPGQHVIQKGEDIAQGESILKSGCRIRPQELGLLAALGKEEVRVFKLPRVGIVSTGDEIVPIDVDPAPGQVRDINSYTLMGQIAELGATPVCYGIVQDNFDMLFGICRQALEECDTLLISGGSSVGVRDYTTDAMASLPGGNILFHGIAISPGKPTILAEASAKAVWGLPGHAVSAMVVFSMVVRPFLEKISGRASGSDGAPRVIARLTRNIASAQGRTDFVRVRLFKAQGKLHAEPILGKSGLIRTMVLADGLIEIGTHTEGVDKDTPVEVIPI